jgi:UDPglucose 6-dehydrogenase
MSDYCPRVDIHVVDKDQKCIDSWNVLNDEPLPGYERVLQNVLERIRSRNHHFSTDVMGLISTADVIFIAENTPNQDRGHGAGAASDLSCIEKASSQITQSASRSSIQMERLTLPVRTAAGLGKIFRHSKNSSLEIL